MQSEHLYGDLRPVYQNTMKSGTKPGEQSGSLRQNRPDTAPWQQTDDQSVSRGKNASDLIPERTPHGSSSHEDLDSLLLPEQKDLNTPSEALNSDHSTNEEYVVSADGSLVPDFDPARSTSSLHERSSSTHDDISRRSPAVKFEAKSRQVGLSDASNLSFYGSAGDEEEGFKSRIWKSSSKGESRLSEGSLPFEMTDDVDNIDALLDPAKYMDSLDDLETQAIEKCMIGKTFPNPADTSSSIFPRLPASMHVSLEAESLSGKFDVPESDT